MNTLAHILRSALLWRPRLRFVSKARRKRPAVATRLLPIVVAPSAGDAPPIITLSAIESVRNDIRAGKASLETVAHTLALFRAQRQHVELLLRRQTFYQLQREWGERETGKSAMVAQALRQIEQELAGALR